MEWCKCRKINKGFSIAELIIVLGIAALIFTISDYVYTNFQKTNNLKIATASVVESVRLAESNSVSSKDDSKWGIKIINNQIIIFKGTSYSGRDVSKDQSFDIPRGVTVSGADEFVFEKITGFSLSSGTITLINNVGSVNILINEKGTIIYQ